MNGRLFTPCDPFNFERLYGGEKYSLQNMLLREVNMPTMAFPGELVYETWDDRAGNAFWDNSKSMLQSHYTADAFFAGVPEANFLAWASAVFTALENKIISLTGATLIRYTNVASGYPCLRLTGIIATKDLESRRYGITTPPKRMVVSMTGGMVFEEY